MPWIAAKYALYFLFELVALLGAFKIMTRVFERKPLGRRSKPEAYPFYSNVSDTAEFYGHSNYNSLQAKLVKRFGSGGALLANYTWSKNLGNTDTLNGFLEAKPSAQSSTSGEGTIQDYNNLNGEYSLLSYNVKERAVISYVLNLPFGKGQRFAKRARSTCRHPVLWLERERNHDLPVRVPVVHHRGSIQSLNAVLRRWGSPSERSRRLR